jgi:hypothetical protein
MEDKSICTKVNPQSTHISFYGHGEGVGEATLLTVYFPDFLGKTFFYQAKTTFYLSPLVGPGQSPAHHLSPAGLSHRLRAQRRSVHRGRLAGPSDRVRRLCGRRRGSSNQVCRVHGRGRDYLWSVYEDVIHVRCRQL